MMTTKKLFLTGTAMLFLSTGTAYTAGVDYVCGDNYSIVIEPKNRTYRSYDFRSSTEPIVSTVFVSKGITIHNDETGQKWSVKTLPRNKSGKVSVRGKVCRKINQG